MTRIVIFNTPRKYNLLSESIPLTCRLGLPGQAVGTRATISQKNRSERPTVFVVRTVQYCPRRRVGK